MTITRALKAGAVAIALAVTGGPVAMAAGEYVTPPSQDFSFKGMFGTYDRVSLQRGFQVYKEVCSGCHAMHHLAYRHLEMIGFSDEEVKAIAAGYTVMDGPNDEGEMFQRVAEPKDRFVKPFPNEQAARAANNGAYPVEMSLIAKARPNGPDYIYALLTGYGDPPEGVTVPDGQYWNEYYPGHQLAMAPPLVEGLVQYKNLDRAEGAPETYEPSVEEMAWDVTNFLMWAAEPHLEDRKQTGWKVLLFLSIFTGLMYVAKRRVWADVH